MTPEEFLRNVWGAQPDADHAFLASKDWESNQWSEYRVTPTGDDWDLDVPDLYFAPVLFKAPRRLKQHACGGVWLFADLDEVDPRSLGYLPPQVAWETSPGRYQAMWRLNEPLGPKAWERLNRAITYRTGADKGGWSLTKVLRVPGTVSTKHGTEWTVRLVLMDWEGVTDAATIREVCSQALPATDPATGRVRLPRRNAREIRREHWSVLSPRARKLIRAKTVRQGDDRSARLWELHNLCLDAGMTTGETVVVVRDTVWNKYKGQRRELRMLMQEAQRAEAQQRSRGQVPERRRKAAVGGATFELVPRDRTQLIGEGELLPNVMLAERFIGSDWPAPTWMVEEIWGKNAFGWWAGEFKAYKTWTILDFAVSVASGTPFLGRFDVREAGPVMYVHDEGKQGEVARHLWRVKSSRGLVPQVDDAGVVLPGKAMPLWVCSFPHLNLTEEVDRNRLVNEIRSKKLRVLILEAWYLMSGAVNENDAAEVNPITKWLMQLTEQEGCSIIVSHHYNKGSGQGVREGNRMSGSGVFARSFESAVFLERKGEENDHTVKLTARHRAHSGTEIALSFRVREDEDEDYNVVFLTPEEVAEMEDVDLGGASSTGGKSAGRPQADLSFLDELEQGEAILITEAAESCGVSVKTLKRRLNEDRNGSLCFMVKRNGRVYVVGGQNPNGSVG